MLGSALDAWTRFENYVCIVKCVLGRGGGVCLCFLVAGVNLRRKFVQEI